MKVAVSISTIDRRDRHDRVGVTRDVSASGLLFHSVSGFEIGERVQVVFRPPRARLSSTTGRIVRTRLDPDGASPFRFVTAVRFDVPLLDLSLA